MNTRSLRRSATRLGATALALLSLGLFCGSARADGPGEDEVTLKNGGAIRGKVVSSEPGTSVKIIELGQTQVRVIPWAQVSDVERGKFAPKAAAEPGPAGPGYTAPPAAAPPATDTPPAPKLGSPGVVRLHIDSPLPATIIEHRSALIGTYGGYGLVLHGERKVCTSPCDAIIDGGQGSDFRLADDDYPSGGRFSLATMSGDVTMHVEPGNSPKHTGGAWMLIFGTIAFGTGLVMFPLGQAAKVTDVSTNVDVNIPNKGIRNAGLGLLGGGAALLGGGIALFVTGATKYTLTPGAAPAAKPTAIAPRYWMGEF